MLKIKLKMYLLEIYHHFIKWSGRLVLWMMWHDIISVDAAGKWDNYHFKKWCELAVSINDDMLNKLEGLS